MATTPKKPTDGIPQPTDDKGNFSVLVELRHRPGMSPSFAASVARDISIQGFSLDEEYEPVSMEAVAPGMGMAASITENYIVRGTIKKEADMDTLRSQPDVVDVWRDTPISPIGEWEPGPQPEESPAAAACPIPPCDCSPGTPKGNMADVANYLGVDQIWASGVRGSGIIVGVLDSGITAQGRPVKAGETSRRIPRVIGGWPSDWGTESGKWGNHGNMCATDVLGMAPEAQLYDLRIAGTGGSPGTISRALQAFNWAINRHRTDGTPHVLTNSWGIFQETWDTTYARNPNHPFTRKVVEAINEGILVLFAAGNCGDTCPDGRCGADNGPGRSIWGANGHPLVMTVGAVNKNEQFIGYSSRGPAALDPNKPDFCSISHFTGYNTSDSGTSAATPICAGVVALLKQAKPSLNQDQCKTVLKSTAKDIGPVGFDQHSGSGIIQARAAYNRLVRPPVITLAPSCRRTLLPPCRRTVIPPCRPTINPRDPRCIRPTLLPTDPRCTRPTLNPRDPRCQRRTIIPLCPRPTITGCPRPTLVCPRPTTTGCPRPTLVCPRPTTTGCPRPTLLGCPRPTLLGCPRPTLIGPQCIRKTLTCPRPTMPGACPRITFSAAMCTPVPEFDMTEDYEMNYGGYEYDDYGYDDYYDPYNQYGQMEFDYEAGYGDYADYYDPYAAEEEWYDEDSYDDYYNDWDIDDDDPNSGKC